MSHGKWATPSWLTLMACAGIAMAVTLFVPFYMHRYGAVLNVATELGEAEAVSAALMYYAHLNGGKLPNGWEDLRAAGIARMSPQNPDGVEIISTMDSPYIGIQGWRIADTRRYRVIFGIGPDRLCGTSGTARAADGQSVQILAPEGRTEIGTAYSALSSQIARAMLDSSAEGCGTAAKVPTRCAERRTGSTQNGSR